MLTKEEIVETLEYWKSKEPMIPMSESQNSLLKRIKSGDLDYLLP